VVVPMRRHGPVERVEMQLHAAHPRQPVGGKRHFGADVVAPMRLQHRLRPGGDGGCHLLLRDAGDPRAGRCRDAECHVEGGHRERADLAVCSGEVRVLLKPDHAGICGAVEHARRHGTWHGREAHPGKRILQRYHLGARGRRPQHRVAAAASWIEEGVVRRAAVGQGPPRAQPSGRNRCRCRCRCCCRHVNNNCTGTARTTQIRLHCGATAALLRSRG
jgi:hypothetical protein